MNEMAYNPFLVSMDLEDFKTILKKKRTIRIVKNIQIYFFYIVDIQPFYSGTLLYGKQSLCGMLYILHVYSLMWLAVVKTLSTHKRHTPTLVIVILRYFYTKSVCTFKTPLFTPIGMGTKMFCGISAFKYKVLSFNPRL